MAGTIAIRLSLFTMLWWILGGAIASVVGIASVLLATLASIWLMPPATWRLSVVALPGFLLFFVTHSMIGGMQVALFALRRRPDLQPGVVRIPLRLPGQGARLFLAGTLNLLPGTLSMGLEDDCLHLHVLDLRQPTEHQVRAAEEHVARLLGSPLP
jgi:multicomponent Na+:H+ antiporter subunit E